ncbi:uncharacterized protein LOC115626015 [Scaptodrosophila lebanonensis]|uniref:Uncharacterized protein LOC115626015 n=1 Tax=Drosophila lebanonensis TaxID=7225 RepID=A0A6J2TPT6_DROLE|nr:uncharacterized protein LOC115626015 [Scaptodrosophila lebanonensis]
MAATYTCTQFVSFTQPTSYTTSTSTTYTLDAARFGQRDLSLFIESLETISRIERERHERRQRRREQKLQQARMAELEVESRRSRSPTPTADDAVDEPLMFLESKCIPYVESEAISKETPDYYSCDDEAYGSGAHSPRSSVTYCSCGGSGISSGSTDSTESGVFGSTPPPQSELSSKPKHRSARARIIDMVLKRDRAPSAEALDQTVGCEDLLNETIRQQYDNMDKKSRRRGFACMQGSPEERFLDKALRYLTL